MSPVDPVNLDPIPSLLDSYTFHSVLPDDFDQSSEQNKEGWIMGIDEAGRGPVLGPMVYAAAYCPVAFKPTLEDLGFDDSKALSAEAISANMLRRVPINLNQQAQDATMGLIRDALDRGLNIRECFVDALGPSQIWQDRLSAAFPTIKFLVCPKADSLFKIVGAASIIAKVTRDRYIEHWTDPEGPPLATREGELVIRGSGYPSDPKTQAFLREHVDPVFGYRGMVRFSWATIRVLLEKHSAACAWADDVQQPSAKAYFANPDKGRSKMWQDLGISAVGEL
ncbi:uncharacterized protein CcaverHIS019_0702470 [Cutaneotrichosporon cavernicola]|uniref:Ribonuclease n=1 Tax=Cutaneotrichosporon cavernicola TaxID=279322 RepID=A0AA48QYS0_9TREE|nr:uncharacterized protein CcaverHIS019_0702470 [Cutaneotrichosporon cavernicola]BEI94666.1 hypothetical protein CcaverHIS019_0702470 [Cutaneotrichosporon cavernicola]